MTYVPKLYKLHDHHLFKVGTSLPTNCTTTAHEFIMMLSGPTTPRHVWQPRACDKLNAFYHILYKKQVLRTESSDNKDTGQHETAVQFNQNYHHYSYCCCWYCHTYNLFCLLVDSGICKTILCLWWYSRCLLREWRRVWYCKVRKNSLHDRANS